MPDIEKVTRKNTKRPDQIGGGKPGPGRKPGIPNKANGLLKDAIIQAAEEAGGREGIVGYLTQQARKHPAAFLALIGRVLPLQVRAATRANRSSSRSCTAADTRTATSRNWSSTLLRRCRTTNRGVSEPCRRPTGSADRTGIPQLVPSDCNVGGW